MLMYTIRDSLSFDDVLLLPRYSDVMPNEVDLTTYLTKQIKLKIPIISAAMDTVTEASMAIAIAEFGGIGVIHKNMPPECQATQVEQVKNKNLLVGAAVGIGLDTKDRINVLLKANVDTIVIDTAHGHSKPVIELVKWLRDTYPTTQIVAGNIGTAAAAIALKEAGADAVKVGLGPGSICTTRIISGVGVPQLTAILDVAEALKGSNVKVIADGGIRYSGDITKSLAAGADTVMLGNLLAGTHESPGEIIGINDAKFKLYRGMGSLGAIGETADRYFQHNTQKSKLVPEGVEGIVPYKGSLSDTLIQLTGGLRSGMGYLGCQNIVDLHNDAEFIKISNAGIKESHVHDVTIDKEAPNYRI